MVDPRIAHNMDSRILLRLLPHVDQSLLYDVRREFALALSSRQGRQVATWQEGWNLFTGATAHRPGFIRLMTKCKSCSGRGFTHRHVSRNLSRTGNPYACGECGGVPGRRISTLLRAMYAPIPEQTPEQTTEQTPEQTPEQAGENA